MQSKFPLSRTLAYGGRILARSAEFHSAVSQIFNLQRLRTIGGAGQGGGAADCKSAIRQIANLHYEEGLCIWTKRTKFREAPVAAAPP